MGLALLLAAGAQSADAAARRVSAISFDDLLELDVGELGRLQVSTASRHPEKFARTPGTLLVVSRETIRERGYRSLAALLADLPAIDVQKHSDGSTNNRIAVRGVVGNNKLLILQDGVRISSPSGDPIAVMDNFPLYHVRQVEVVYGAASAVYGADAFTGVVNLITDMDPLSGSEVVVQAGEFGHRHAHVNLIHAAGERVRLQFGGHWRRDDNADLSKSYPRSFPAERFQPGDRFAQPSASHSVNARLDWADSVSLGWNHSRYRTASTVSAQPQAVLYRADAEYIHELHTVWGEYRHRFDDRLSGRVTVDWSRYEVDPRSQFVNQFTAFERTGYKFSTNERWRIEPQLSYEQGPHRLIAGLSLEWIDALPKTGNLPWRYDRGAPFFYPDTGDALEVEIFRQRYRNRGVHVQYSREFGQRTLVHLGARHDDNSQYGRSFTPRAGVNYTVAPGAVVKYLYSEAFLAPSPFFAYENWGSAFDSTATPPFSWFFHVPNADLKPERVKSHEIRFVHTPSSDLEWHAGVYHTNTHDIIYPQMMATPQADFVPGGLIGFTRQNTNIGKLRATGADVGFDYTLHGATLRTRLWGNASYVDGRLSGVGARKVRPPFVSHAKLNLGVTWTWRNAYQLSPSVRWVSAGQGPANHPPARVPGYTVVDLQARWLGLGERGELFVHVENLFDRRHYHIGDGGGSGLTRSPQDPRRIMAGMALRF